MRIIAVLLSFALSPAVIAQTGEGNLIKDPGFEAAPAGNAFEGWAFVNHDQDFIRGEAQAQDYHSGLKAAAVSVGRTPKVYASWYQHVAVKTDSELPDTVSVWYRAPDAPFSIVLSFVGVRDGVVDRKGSQTLALEKSRDWRQFTGAVECPSGTTDVMIELRVTAQGDYRFDDVSLSRKEQANLSGKPYRLLFVGITQDDLTYLWKDELKKAGWEKLSCEQWENLNPMLLKQCKTVVLANLPLRADLTAQDRALADLLVEYVKAGGGLLLTQNMDQIVTGMTLQFYLAERFGTRILYEKVISDKEQTQTVGAWWADTFTYTDQVMPPLSEGVKGFPYQSFVDMSSLCGVLPFLPAEGWQVTLTAGPKSRSEIYLCGLDEVDRKARAEGFKSEVPLAGVREFGQGRVAYIGMKPMPVFFKAMKTPEDRETYEAYMVRDFLGKPNGMLRFYENAFQWLGAKSEAVAGADLKLVLSSRVQYTDTWKLHRGLIGPRTAYSTGSSTPEEYVQKAKSAGFDFIVFLEDFAGLKPEGFEKLKADCQRLSSAGFLAVPGVTYLNSDGNNEYAFGESLKLPSKWMLTPDGKRLAVYPHGADKDGVNNEQTWLYQLLGFENVSGWYRFGSNPYPFYDARDVNAQGVITQEGGQTVDEGLVRYTAEQSRAGQLLWPQALTLMRSAAEIDLVTRGVYYHNIVGAEGTQMLHTLLNTLQGRSARNLYPGAPCFGSTSVTNGPVIELLMPRGDTDAQGNLWNPALQEWALDLKVTSPVGLREVTIMDGDATIRRFLPGGKTEFTFKSQVSKERQKYLWVRAVDKQGHEAISRDVQCDSWLLRDQQCADRNNQLLYSSQRRPDGSEYYIGYGADTCLADKGPWNGRLRPVGAFVFDSKLGSGAMSYDGSPENHPQLFLHPYVVVDGKVPGSVGWVRQLVADQEGGPHELARRVVSSSEVLVADRILDGVFSPDANPIIHVWHTLYPVKPSRYLDTTARCTLYLPKVDGITAYLWEQSFTAKQAIPVKAEQPFTFCLGSIAGWLGQTDKSQRLVVVGGKVTELAKLDGHPMTVTPFNRGDYIGILYGVFGSLAVYSLTDGLVLWGDGINHEIGIKTPAGTIAKGTKLNARLLLVGINRLEADPVKMAAQVASAYGLTGKPEYRVRTERGSVLSQDYVLSLQAGKQGAFRGTLSGLQALPGNLGSTVGGLNSNWCAVLQEGEKTRIIPVEQGVGYAVLRAEDEGKPVFIGHPFIADNPQVVLSLARSKDWATWVLEIHNPTNKALKVKVSTSAGVRGLKLRETVQLPAGSSVMREVGAAPQQ
jgi:hypothetical protein